MLMLKYYSQLASIKRIQVLVEDLKKSYMLAVFQIEENLVLFVKTKIVIN
jgi:hypothetical protein